MRKDVQKETATRLHKLQGQLEGIEKMMATGRSCTEVLTQISAARAGLDKLANLLITEHLENCLVNSTDETCSPELDHEERVNEVRRTLDRFLTSMNN